MDFSFFTTNNKSGYKTREKWFKTNHPEVYNQIIDYCFNLKSDLNFKEKIWFYFNKLVERPKCQTCNKELTFRNRFDVPYGEFCSLDCINNNKSEMIKRQVQTFQKKYNVDFYPQHEDFIKKQKKTKLEKYNDENYNNTKKSKETKKIKYGNENYNNVDQYKITCVSKYNSENYATSNHYKKTIEDNYKNSYPNIDFVNIGKLMVSIKCPDCSGICELTKQLLYERYKRNHVICLDCNPIGNKHKSSYETELSEFLSSINIEHERTNRTSIKKELDIYIPSKKIAVEFNGLYWHNELFVPSDYHLKKTVECLENGIELVHIFEDEWNNKKEIVKSIIKNKVGITENIIYARKCVIKEINSNECKKFLDENHIQGNVKSKVRIGLFQNDNLVSIMTFTRGRLITGGKKEDWELTRFCNKINTNVVGGASKLFKFFITKYNPKKVISYSDIRLFNGELYNKLGFIKKHQSKPNYWYVINGNRYYRFNFRKSKLINEGFSKDKTEKEIMFERKIYRIYDCGNIRWEFSNKKL